MGGPLFNQFVPTVPAASPMRNTTNTNRLIESLVCRLFIFASPPLCRMVGGCHVRTYPFRHPSRAGSLSVTTHGTINEEKSIAPTGSGLASRPRPRNAMMRSVAATGVSLKVQARQSRTSIHEDSPLPGSDSRLAIPCVENPSGTGADGRRDRNSHISVWHSSASRHVAHEYLIAVTEIFRQRCRSMKTAQQGRTWRSK